MRKYLLALLVFALPAFAQQFPYGPAPNPIAGSTVGFQPLAKTSLLAASNASASVALAVTTSLTIQQVQVYNAAATTAYVVFCATTSGCTASAGSAGTATADYPVAAGAVIVMTPPAGAGAAAAILASGSGTVAFTPGAGL